VIEVKFFFDHLPKTAGTSLHTFFCDAFGEDNISPQNVNHSFNSFCTLYNQKSIICGHFSFKVHDLLPKDRFSMTIIREPIERSLSQYSMIKNDCIDANISQGERFIKHNELEELLHNEFCINYFSNIQCIHFASFFHSSPGMLSQDELLRLARKGLDQYDLVGTTERLSEFVDCLKKYFSISDNSLLKKINATSRRINQSDLSPWVLQRLKDINQADFELWRYASYLFDEKKYSIKKTNERLHNLEDNHVEQSVNKDDNSKDVIQAIDTSLTFLGASIVNHRTLVNEFFAGDMATLRVSFRAHKDINDLTIGYSIHHSSGTHMFGINTSLFGQKIHCSAGGDYAVQFTFCVNLGIGEYFLNISAHNGRSHFGNLYFLVNDAAKLNVTGYVGVSFEGLARLIPSCECSVLMGDGKIDAYSAFDDQSNIVHLGCHNQTIRDTRGEIVPLASITSMKAREQVVLPVKITNASDMPWACEGRFACFVSYHWKDKNNQDIIFDGKRTSIPVNIIENKSDICVNAIVEGPPMTGCYVLELTIVQEEVQWFEYNSFKSYAIEVEVH
jgi:hypothetical protein